MAVLTRVLLLLAVAGCDSSVCPPCPAGQPPAPVVFDAGVKVEASAPAIVISLHDAAGPCWGEDGWLCYRPYKSLPGETAEHAGWEVQNLEWIDSMPPSPPWMTVHHTWKEYQAWKEANPEPPGRGHLP
jgi:hypothetical protein